MRKVIVPLLITLVCFNICSGLVMADGMILPHSMSVDYVGVRYHNVTVDIKDGYAVTRVQQEFYNPYSFTVHGRYIFPIPPDAVISKFQALIDGKQQSVEQQDASITNAVLQDVIRERHDPSLFQYFDWKTLAFNIDLPAGSSKKMTLQYEELLMPSGGLYTYRYVLSTERYTSTPLENVSLEINLQLSAGISNVYSSNYNVTTEWIDSKNVKVRWQAEYVLPTKDFELFFSPSDDGFGGGLLIGRQDYHDHLMFMFAPQLGENSVKSIQKDIVFIIDRSGSMNGVKIEQARSALNYILGRLDEGDRFSIIGFDDKLSIFSDELKPVSKKQIGEARRFVDDLYADGTTDLDSALQKGIEIIDQSEPGESSAMIVFLTDGLPTAGILDTTLIADRIEESNSELNCRLHVLGVGYDVNTHLLDRLAADNNSYVKYIQPGENLELVFTQFYDRISAPVLTDIHIEFSGLEIDDAYPKQIPDLFKGSSLLFTARYKAANDYVKVIVTGDVAGEKKRFIYNFDLNKIRNYDFVARLWATRYAGALMDIVRVQGESYEIVDKIRDLGLAYGIVTPYTSFAIVAQDSGPASLDNMSLYSNVYELNRSSGRITIQARVQNQAYQEANNANIASGPNTFGYGGNTAARIANKNIDLNILRSKENINGPIDDEWILRNIAVDLNIKFGSKEYFALANDSDARLWLQNGTEVIFSYNGKIISVQDQNYALPETQTDSSSIIYKLMPLLSRFFRIL